MSSLGPFPASRHRSPLRQLPVHGDHRANGGNPGVDGLGPTMPRCPSRPMRYRPGPPATTAATPVWLRGVSYLPGASAKDTNEQMSAPPEPGADRGWCRRQERLCQSPPPVRHEAWGCNRACQIAYAEVALDRRRRYRHGAAAQLWHAGHHAMDVTELAMQYHFYWQCMDGRDTAAVTPVRTSACVLRRGSCSASGSSGTPPPGGGGAAGRFAVGAHHLLRRSTINVARSNTSWNDR